MRAVLLLALFSGVTTVLAIPPNNNNFNLLARAAVTKCNPASDYDPVCGFERYCAQNGTCTYYTNCSPACVPPAVCVNGLCYCNGGNDIACGTICADWQNDPKNCGSCGWECDAGQLCKEGSCVAGGDGCSGKCTSEQQCFDNKCYCKNTDQLPCAGNTCPDTQNDVKNCGGCDKTCAAGQKCTKGTCTGTTPAMCSNGQTLCGAKCRNVSNDNNHCGGCGTKGKVGENCSAGKCQSAGSGSCSAGQAVCAGGCRNLVNDNEHCGKCGNKCGVGRNCRRGVCV